MVNCPLQLSEDAIKILGLLQGPQESHCSLHVFFCCFCNKTLEGKQQSKRASLTAHDDLKNEYTEISFGHFGFCMKRAHKQICDFSNRTHKAITTMKK